MSTPTQNYLKFRRVKSKPPRWVLSILTVGREVNHLIFKIIYLHWLGGTGVQWSNYMRRFIPPYARSIFPTAPSRRINGLLGKSSTAWFNVARLPIDLSLPEDEENYNRTSIAIYKLIELQEQLYNITPDRIVLAGISQGGVIALHAGLHYHRKLAGIVAQSAWLPMMDKFDPSKTLANKDTLILQTHGQSDMVVPFAHADRSSKTLEQFFTNYQFIPYLGKGHVPSARELQDVGRFFSAAIPPIASRLLKPQEETITYQQSQSLYNLTHFFD